MRATGIDSFAEYYAFLTSPAGGGEMPLFLDAITTNETYFFRDIHQYEWLGETFLPEDHPAGCAAETPASAANLVGGVQHGRGTVFDRTQGYGQETAVFAGWSINPVGTDLSGAVLAAARAGSYDERAVHLIEPEERRRSSRRMPQPSAGS